jgi:hypothetical protein
MNSNEDDETKLAGLISMYSNSKQGDILKAAREKADHYGETTLYYLRVWESKASCGGFNLKRERL